MWDALQSSPADLLLLDIMLPGTSGIDICREVRRTSDVPIIFLSAKGTETDRIVGLELGADDYLPKPFGVRELVARVRAVLRRHAIERPVSARERGRSEERRVGKEGVSTCRTRGSPYHSKKKQLTATTN